MARIPADDADATQAALDTGMAVLLLDLLLEGEMPGYAYVAMPAGKVAVFLSGFAGSAIDWPDYVRLLYRGEGDRPPEEVRAWIYDTYGIES